MTAVSLSRSSMPVKEPEVCKVSVISSRQQLQWINGERRRFVAAALSQFPI
jgi:hypothetical protein